VRFYTTLGDLSKYATGELGVWMGNQKVVKSDEANLTYDITFPSVRDKVQKDMNSWQGICGVYQAKGSEHYLVIGNFASNEKTPNEKVKRPRGETRMQVNSAYYYIDNVEVYPVKDRSSCTCEQLKDAESEFIFSRKGAVNPNLKPSQRVDGQIYYYKRFQSTLDPSMEPWFTELVQDMKADPAIKIRLVGHTDATEMSRTRVRPDLAELAQQRAEGLRDALVEAGVETARITVVGKGSDEPSDTSGTDVGMSKNRRVEVELVP
jgi:outer membrane protein OmpA-like peptidoglycan-associated protein